jgi:putative spermidine/putrescine transport system ATP-binding protein
MVRPHRIALGTGDAPAADGVNRVSGVIRRVTYVGDLIEYSVDVDGLACTVEQPTTAARAPVAPGTDVALSWRIEDTLAFGASA